MPAYRTSEIRSQYHFAFDLGIFQIRRIGCTGGLVANGIDVSLPYGNYSGI